MIPKIIHYCWFGRKPIPSEVQLYIDSWKKFLPEFEIKQWDETNFDVNELLYTRQAYYAKKYAFVSDVARLKALSIEGGLYFDTDILVKKTFPESWFELDGFGSFEHDKYVQTGVIASKPHHSIIDMFLEGYRNRTFFHGTRYDNTTNVSHFTSIMIKVGFYMDNTEQTIDGFTLFPQSYLCANDWLKGRYDDSDTYAIHDFAGGWGKDALNKKLQFRYQMLSTIIKWRLYGYKHTF